MMPASQRIQFAILVCSFAMGCKTDGKKIQIPAPPAPWAKQVVQNLSIKDIPIPQLPKSPQVDGQLDDWDLRRAVLVNQQSILSPPSDLKDLSVKVAFAFDFKNLYMALIASDQKPEFPQRAWRYGDGCMITFGNSEEGPATQRFVTFGLAKSGKGKDKPVLVNRDGVYFPQEDLQDIQFSVSMDQANGQIHYEVAIPWHHLDPLRPLIHPSWGINVTYTDRDAGKVTRVQLISDPHADTELTNWRRVHPARFLPRSVATVQCQSISSRTFALAGDNLVIKLGCLFPERVESYQIRSILHASNEFLIQPDQPPAAPLKGWTTPQTSFNIPKLPTGTYRTEIELLRGSEKVFSDKNELFVVGMDALAMHAELKNLKESKRGKHPLFPALEARMEWIQDFLLDTSPVASPEPLIKYLDEARMLLKILKSKEPIWSQRGKIFRFAHRSRIDGTLQPYSVFVPSNYNPSKPPPLMVVLHGSGVDEKRTIAAASRKYKETGWLILAPRARGLSDWYLGPAGDDVIECITHLKQVLPYDPNRIFLEGFSMGGYGAWRISLLHPELFRRVVIRSGAVQSPPYLAHGDNIADLVHRANKHNLSYFIVHGAKDNAVKIEPVRKIVSKLTKLGVSHKYIELPDAAHGGYRMTDKILDWLNSDER